MLGKSCCSRDKGFSFSGSLKSIQYNADILCGGSVSVYIYMWLEFIFCIGQRGWSFFCSNGMLYMFLVTEINMSYNIQPFDNGFFVVGNVDIEME